MATPFYPETADFLLRGNFIVTSWPSGKVLIFYAVIPVLVLIVMIWRLLLNNMSLRSFGSQGQQRSGP